MNAAVVVRINNGYVVCRKDVYLAESDLIGASVVADGASSADSWGMVALSLNPEGMMAPAPAAGEKEADDDVPF